MSHTQGPWFAGVVTDGSGNVSKSDGFVHGADGTRLDIRIESANAGDDARLIAAAPDLLASLLEIRGMLFARPDIVRVLRPLMGFAENAISERAGAAITKATTEDMGRMQS